MNIIIQSDLGTTLNIVHVPDGDLDDCTAMMDLESKMLDARQGFRIWCSAAYPTGVKRMDTWIREQRDKAGSHGFVLAPALTPTEPETECEICGGPTRDGEYCNRCHDRVRDEEKLAEVEERKTRWQIAKEKLARVFGIG